MPRHRGERSREPAFPERRREESRRSPVLPLSPGAGVWKHRLRHRRREEERVWEQVWHARVQGARAAGSPRPRGSPLPVTHLESGVPLSPRETSRCR